MTLITKAIALVKIKCEALISIPYISHSAQFKKYKTNIPHDRSETLLVLYDFITCGNIKDVPITAAE